MIGKRTFALIELKNSRSLWVADWVAQCLEFCLKHKLYLNIAQQFDLRPICLLLKRIRIKVVKQNRQINNKTKSKYNCIFFNRGVKCVSLWQPSMLLYLGQSGCLSTFHLYGPQFDSWTGAIYVDWVSPSLPDCVGFPYEVPYHQTEMTSL